MSVKVEFVFANEDEAIVALAAVRQAKVNLAKRIEQAKQNPSAAAAGEIVGRGAAAAVAEKSEQPAAAVGTTPPTRQRKPRADKGQPREPYGPRTETAATGAQGTPAPSTDPRNDAQAPTATSTTTPVAAPQSAAPVEDTPPAAVLIVGSKPAAADPTLEDVQKTVEALFAARNYDDTRALVSRFGVARAKEIPADMRAEFIAKAKAMIADPSVQP
jgi:hypothetical protein